MTNRPTAAPPSSGSAEPPLVRVGVVTQDTDVGGGLHRGTLLLIFPADIHGHLVAYCEHATGFVDDDYWSESSIGELLESAGFLELEGSVAAVLRRDVFPLRARAE